MRRIAIVDMAASEQIDHSTICGCHISSREYSSKNASAPQISAMKNPAKLRSGKLDLDRSSEPPAVIKYRRIPKPSVSGGTAQP